MDWTGLDWTDAEMCMGVENLKIWPRVLENYQNYLIANGGKLERAVRQAVLRWLDV
jgi:hypothetical protein